MDKEAEEEDQVKMTIYDNITDAEWCIGLEPTNQEGRYLLTTMHKQLSEARKWHDDNLEELFLEYIPQFQTFTTIEGYAYPK